MTDPLNEATPRPWRVRLEYGIVGDYEGAYDTLREDEKPDDCTYEVYPVGTHAELERLLQVERAAIRARDNLQVLMFLVHGAIKEEATEAWLELESALRRLADPKASGTSG
jgi:hypothetical protein